MGGGQPSGPIGEARLSVDLPFNSTKRLTVVKETCN